MKLRHLKAALLRLGPRLAGAVGLVLGLTLLLALPASAEMTNGCRGTLAGQDVGTRSSTDPNQAIQVQWDQSATATVASGAPITGYHVDLEFAGFPYTVAHGSSNGNSWSREVPVRQYAVYGVGLYKVIGTSTGPGACSASFLVNIVGKDPLSTPAGQAAAAVLAIGALGTVAATLASAAGTPVHARPYLRDLQMVETGQLPESALGPYVSDAINVPLEQDFHYVPDAINVPLEQDFHYVPDAISVPELPASHNEFPPDAINVQELPASHSEFPPDAINVQELPASHNEFPPDAINVQELPASHSGLSPDAVAPELPASHGGLPPDTVAPELPASHAGLPPDTADVPGPPPRRGI